MDAVEIGTAILAALVAKDGLSSIGSAALRFIQDTNHNNDNYYDKVGYKDLLRVEDKVDTFLRLRNNTNGGNIADDEE